MKFAGPLARLKSGVAGGREGGMENILRNQTLQARSSSLGCGFTHSKCRWSDLQEKRDMLWFMFFKNYSGSCTAILMVSSAFLESVSIGSWAPSCWLKSLEQSVFPWKAPWICWFSGFESLEGLLLLLFCLSCWFSIHNLKNFPISSVTRHSLWDTRFEDAFPAAHVCSFPLFPFTNIIIWPATSQSNTVDIDCTLSRPLLSLQPITMSSGIFTFPFSTHFDNIRETQSQLCRPRWSERNTGLMAGRYHGIDCFYEVQIQHWGVHE